MFASALCGSRLRIFEFDGVTLDSTLPPGSIGEFPRSKSIGFQLPALLLKLTCLVSHRWNLWKCFDWNGCFLTMCSENSGGLLLTKGHKERKCEQPTLLVSLWNKTNVATQTSEWNLRQFLFFQTYKSTSITRCISRLSVVMSKFRDIGPIPIPYSISRNLHPWECLLAQSFEGKKKNHSFSPHA